MAAGDINSRAINSVGDLVMLSGTIDVDNSARTFAIADTGTRIVSISLTNQSTVDNAFLAVKNSNDGTENTAMGSIRVTGPNSSADTVEYVALCTGPF
tara:strand:- start:7658 stop:7951 length:294 start_codon:yes stop_codon:yes gene_type:complete